MKYLGCIQREVNYRYDLNSEPSKGPQSSYGMTQAITLPCGHVFDPGKDYESFTIGRDVSFIYFNYLNRNVVRIEHDNQSTPMPALYSHSIPVEFKNKIVIHKVVYINHYNYNEFDYQKYLIEPGMSEEDFEDYRDFNEALKRFRERNYVGQKVSRQPDFYSHRSMTCTDILIFSYAIDDKEIDGLKGFYFDRANVVLADIDVDTSIVHPQSRMGMEERALKDRDAVVLEVVLIDNEDRYKAGYIPFHGMVCKIKPEKDATRRSGFYVTVNVHGERIRKYYATKEEFFKEHGFYESLEEAKPHKITHQQQIEERKIFRELQAKVAAHHLELEKTHAKIESSRMATENERIKHHYTFRDYDRRDQQDSLKFGYTVLGMIAATGLGGVAYLIKGKK